MVETVQTIHEVEDAIKGVLDDKFGENVPTIALYDDYTARDDNDLPVPALLISIDVGDFDESENTGEGTDPVRLDITIHCVMSSQSERHHSEVREFSRRVGSTIRGKRFGLASKTPTDISFGASEFFKSGKNGFDTWHCTWSQVFYFGESVWEELIQAPKVMVSWSPDVGEGNED